MGTKGRLLNKLSKGNSHITIFENKGKKGSFLTFVLDKGYRDYKDGSFKYTNSFSKEEFKDLTELIPEALKFKAKKGVKQDGKPGPEAKEHVGGKSSSE